MTRLARRSSSRPRTLTATASVACPAARTSAAEANHRIEMAVPAYGPDKAQAPTRACRFAIWRRRPGSRNGKPGLRLVQLAFGCEELGEDRRAAIGENAADDLSAMVEARIA